MHEGISVHCTVHIQVGVKEYDVTENAAYITGTDCTLYNVQLRS